jgi:hypothetical protein
MTIALSHHCREYADRDVGRWPNLSTPWASFVHHANWTITRNTHGTIEISRT